MWGVRLCLYQHSIVCKVNLGPPQRSAWTIHELSAQPMGSVLSAAAAERDSPREGGRGEGSGEGGALHRLKSDLERSSSASLAQAPVTRNTAEGRQHNGSGVPLVHLLQFQSIGLP